MRSRLTAFVLATVLAVPSLALAIPGADCGELSFTVPLAFDIYQGRVEERAQRALLDQVAERLRACPEQSFELQVHTDTVRMSSFNLRQSQAVAEHLRALLVRRGLDASRLAPCGYGEEQPGAATPDWDQDSANNRLIVRPIEGDARSFTCRPTAR